ncbi:MAG: PEP-CTERM sorting domain-containing protein [bacterium]|nr:PEP-CTERM sorting domain-containing protein [bacterium]
MHRIVFLTLIGLGLCSSMLQGAPVLDLKASSGPASTSDYFPEYAQAAAADMSFGDPETYPGAYQPLNGFIDPEQLIATSEPMEKSWRASTDLTSQTQNENGNYLWFHYNLMLEDGSDPFLLSAGSIRITSPDGILDTFDGFEDHEFSFYTQGTNYGPDCRFGTADDILVESGSDTPVHAVRSVGVGIAYDASGYPDGPLDERVDEALSYVRSRAGDDITAEIEFDLGDRGTVTATQTVQIVPEPTSLSLLALFGVAVLKRRRRR